VKIAVGSDFASRDQHGRNLEEIALLHEAGLPTGAALLAATAVGAELCGVGDRLGRLAPGLVFDALLLDDDPSDPAIFRRPGSVTGVFKAGAELVPHARVQEALGRKPRKEGAPSRHA
jgi:imidazolonepropionase-like amidohydrolase